MADVQNNITDYVDSFKPDFTESRQEFSDFRETQGKIQADIRDALTSMKQAQQPTKFEKFADLAVQIAAFVDTTSGNDKRAARAIKRLPEIRKQMDARRGAKRDAAFQGFKTELAVLGEEGAFNAREFNAILGQLDREQKIRDAAFTKEHKLKELGLSERELNERSFHQTELERIRRQEGIDKKERNKLVDKETKRYNTERLKIAQATLDEKKTSDADRAAANAEFSAGQIKIAMELAIDQLGDFPKFQTTGIITTKEGDPSPLEQYTNALHALKEMYLESMPQIVDPDTSGTDAVDTVQGSLGEIESGFSPQGGQSIKELMNVVSERDLIRDRSLQEIIESAQGFLPPQPTASTRVR